jgi:adenylate cyclase class 1
VHHANRNINCYSLTHSKISKLQLNKVFSHLVELFTDPETTTSTRYFLPGGNTYFLLQRQNDVLSYSLLENEDLIQVELASPQIDFSQIYFDTEVLKRTPIPYFYTFNRPKIIQLFAMAQDTSVDLYIIDERGSLCVRRHYNTGPRQLLTAYSVFLETILTRGMLDYFLTIEYFVAETDSENSISCKKVHLDPAPIWQYLNIRITGEEVNNLRTHYTIYCNEKEFSPMVYGDQVFKAASDYILHLRRSKEHYPIHITDIDVPYSTLGVNNPDGIQTLHLLKYKQEIEEQLNQKVN